MTFPEAIRFLLDLATRFISPLPVAAEWLLVAITVMAVAAIPRLVSHPLAAMRDTLRRAARHPKLAILICGLLPVTVRLCLLPAIAVPEPSIHDEFSHLLLADTLAHGRLTNPPHPLWQHFESIHIIQQPTYASMYPPAQGGFLAIGQCAFRDPWAGVVLSVGLMCAAACWMMQGWLRPAWAFYGTLLLILKIGILGFWMNSYMSGAVPALGGALLAGSLPRLRRGRAHASHAVLFALGLVILLNSRPLEGALLGGAAALYLLPALFWLWRKSATVVIRRVALPAGIVLACGTGFIAYYNWRVTGSPTRLPYMVNRDTYGWPENLAFLPAKHVTFRHRVLEDMYALEAGRREQYRTVRGVLGSLASRLFENWTFLAGPVLTAPLLLMPWLARRRRTRPLVLFIALVAFLNLFQLVLYPYHLGPVIPILFALIAEGMRHLYLTVSRIRRHRALAFALAVPLCVILVGAMKQEAAPLNLPLAYWEIAAEPQRDSRAYIQEWLSARPGNQLVIVRYAPNHSPNQEWVYNGADIDRGKVVWAREMDAVSNHRLLDYFSGREAWLLEADVSPYRVKHYEDLPE